MAKVLSAVALRQSRARSLGVTKPYTRGSIFAQSEQGVTGNGRVAEHAVRRGCPMAAEADSDRRGSGSVAPGQRCQGYSLRAGLEMAGRAHQHLSTRISYRAVFVGSTAIP